MASTLAYGCAPEERQQYQESATGAGMKRKASGDLIQPAHGLSEQNRRGRTVVHDILDDSDEYGEKGFDELLVEYGDDLSEHAHRSVGTSFTSDVDASFKVEPGARIEVGHEEPIKTGSGISIKSEPDEPDEPDVKIKLEPLSQKKNGLLRQEEDEFDDDSLDGEFNIHGDELEDEAKTALRVKTMMEQERQGRLRDLIVYGQHSEEIKQALRENVEARKRISPPLKDYPWACTRCHEIIEWFHDIGDPHCFYHSGPHNNSSNNNITEAQPNICRNSREAHSSPTGASPYCDSLDR
jgi:hypothetical protein